MDQDTGADLIYIRNQTLALTIAPLLLIAVGSHRVGLAIHVPLLTGVFRTLLQLSVLGWVLVPIFHYGRDHGWIVLLYVSWMIVLAAHETCRRTKYTFSGMYIRVLLAFVIIISLAGTFAFAILLRPTPLWDPQYVIPMVGLLLGPCMNGAALALDAMLTGLVEQSSELELLLAFGASPYEATHALVLSSIRTGTLPLINNMAVIGLVSIPGTMTGQILSGTPPLEAAKYQILVRYLMALVIFGAILLIVWLVRLAGFDRTSHMLYVDKFVQRDDKQTTSLAERLRNVWTALTRNRQSAAIRKDEQVELLSKTSEDTGLEASSLSVVLLASHGPDQAALVHYLASNMSMYIAARFVETRNASINNPGAIRRVLFRNVNLDMVAGRVFGVVGPSGTGKTQLLRILARLSAPDDNQSRLRMMHGDRENLVSPEEWRCQVRYVTQYKISIPGTPRQFIERICQFKSWLHGKDTPSLNEMMTRTQELVIEWGADASLLESEWKQLSGGEAQRVYLAMAVASRPKVLLMDESLSAVDQNSKLSVEATLKKS